MHVSLFVGICARDVCTSNAQCRITFHSVLIFRLINTQYTQIACYTFRWLCKRNVYNALSAVWPCSQSAKNNKSIISLSSCGKAFRYGFFVWARNLYIVIYYYYECDETRYMQQGIRRKTHICNLISVSIRVCARIEPKYFCTHNARVHIISSFFSSLISPAVVCLDASIVWVFFYGSTHLYLAFEH